MTDAPQLVDNLGNRQFALDAVHEPRLDHLAGQVGVLAHACFPP
jgi:hypothetical protein